MTHNDTTNTNNYSIDTAIVLFLLTLELGRSVGNSSIETMLLAVTSLMVMVLPIALRNVDLNEIRSWFTVRFAIAGFGIALGLVLPTSMEFVPMTLLIPAAMISIYIQFYSLFRLRLVK
ncbi:MAG TPA: hypothetical protein PKA82_06785 [Pyrinomonadaceae bacterium]|nr:hypothetical protein [Pyrinomonadaceae bacterium]